MQRNKMPKGIPKSGMNKGWFKRKQSENNYKGHIIYYDKKGYPTIWLNEEGKDKKVHILVWEEKNGKKLKGYDIHHKDFDKTNYELTNLELLSYSDHRKVHANWVRLDGEWIAKPCKDCKKVLPLNAFYQRKGLTPSHYCIECAKVRFQKRNTEEYKKHRKKYMKQYYQKNKEVKRI